MYEKGHGLEDATMEQKKLQAYLRRRDYDLKELNVQLGSKMDRCAIFEKTCQMLMEKVGVNNDMFDDEQIRQEMQIEDNLLQMKIKNCRDRLMHWRVNVSDCCSSCVKMQAALVQEVLFK